MVNLVLPSLADVEKPETDVEMVEGPAKVFHSGLKWIAQGSVIREFVSKVQG